MSAPAIAPRQSGNKGPLGAKLTEWASSDVLGSEGTQTAPMGSYGAARRMAPPGAAPALDGGRHRDLRTGRGRAARGARGLDGHARAKGTLDKPCTLLTGTRSAAQASDAAPRQLYAAAALVLGEAQ
jgi:hypothetical protein